MTKADFHLLLSRDMVAAIILAVAHDEYVQMDLKRLLTKVIYGGSFIDVKSKFDRQALELEGLRVWRL